MDKFTLLLIVLAGLLWAVATIVCFVEGIKSLNKKDEKGRRKPLTIGLGLLLLFAAGLSVEKIVEFFQPSH